MKPVRLLLVYKLSERLHTGYYAAIAVLKFEGLPP